MCCCCPAAISALFCLWCQSGCSKGTVAGALTFFPPEPALYKFERRDKKGKVLGDDEEATASDEEEETKENELSLKETNEDDDDSGALGEIEGPREGSPLQVETKEGSNPRAAFLRKLGWEQYR